MRIKAHRLLFAALLAPAFISPAVNAQEATPPTALEAKEVIEKAKENAKSQGWELDIEFSQPRRISIELPTSKYDKSGNLVAEKESKTYWYVIYKIANSNTMDANDDARTQVGIPVSTDLNFFVEAISGADALNEPAAESIENDLLKEIELEVIRQRTGEKLDDLENKATQRALYERFKAEKRIKEISEIRFEDAYQSHGDANNHFVLEKIAQKEGLYVYNEATKRLEIALQPASAMMHRMGLVYDYTNEATSEVYYSGVRAVPKRTVNQPGADPELSEVNWLYPSVDSDGALANWYTEDEVNATDAEIKSGEKQYKGTTVVLGPNSKWFGMLLSAKRKAGDVVDSTGRPVLPNEPAYHQAMSDFGVTDGGNNEVVRVAKTRVYQSGQKVLDGYDTGVLTGENSVETYRISGRILDNAELFEADVADMQRADEGRLRRGPAGNVAKEIVDAVGRRDNAYDSIVTLDEGTELFGRPVVGQPVKVLDRYGNAVTRELVVYNVGDYVSKDEYTIWAQRMGVKTSYEDSGLKDKPLTKNHFLVFRPKIRMGQAVDGAQLERDAATGRRYDLSQVSANSFVRDADGTYFTYRIAPVIGADESDSATTYYPYAPLGKAAPNALPVPKFDSFGVWKDWVDPATGRPVPLTDAAGNPVKDAFGIVQNVKSFEYEWRYVFQKEPIVDDEAHMSDRSDEKYSVKNELKMASQTVPAWVDGEGNFASLALRTVYAQKGDSYIAITKVLEESDFSESDWMTSHGVSNAKGGLFEGYTFGFTSAEEEIKDGKIVPLTKEGLEYNGSFTLSQYNYDYIVSRFKNHKVGPESSPSSAATPIKDSHLVENPIEAAPFDGDLGNPIFKAWESFTIPAPMVDEDGNVLTRKEVKIASGLRADDSDAAFGLESLISERYGVLILDGVDDGWDFLNISVRGLRSAYNSTRLAKGGAEGEHHTRKPVYEDWVYMERFAKPGDEHNVNRDLITRGRGRWFLLND